MKRQQKRDKKGDVIMPKLPDDFREKLQQRSWTYVWQFQDKDGFFHPVDYDELPDDELGPSYPRFNLKEVSLFPSPDDPPFDKWINKCHTYEAFLNHYFRDVLTFREMERAHNLQLNHISRLVLPAEKLDETQDIINSFNLQEHKDFILYLLAKIQKVYVDEIEFTERPEEVERIRKLPEEIEKLVTVLENASARRWKPNEEPPARLKQVRFSFATKLGHVTIKDDCLLHNIVDAFIKTWDDYAMKDWKKQLRAYPSIYDDNQRNKQFRPRLARAFHQFFTEQQVFQLQNKKILDREAHCIARLMDVAGIPLYNKQGGKHDVEIDKNHVISLVKSWCSRTELPLRPSHYPINPNFEKLYKYFDKDFINCIGTVQHYYELGTAFAICDRFQIKDHTNEVAHLMKCLSHRHLQIGYQSQSLQEASKKIPELKGLDTLLVNPGSIQSITLSVKDSKEPLEIKSELLLHLVLQAVKKYRETHGEEFNWDLWKSKIEDNPDDSSFSMKVLPELNRPSERFLPQFCRSFYNYLLTEAPPDEKDWHPSERYIGIIANCLQKSWAFSHQHDPEQFIEQKVEKWLKLTEEYPS